MKFTPHLFIGIGETFAMFTLRETYLHEFYSGGRMHYEVRSHHHWNLATTPDEAFRKATEDANQLGLVLTSTREGIEKELREIKRASADELERRAQAAAAQKAEWEADRAARAAQWAREDADMLAAGRYPFGRLKGEEFGIDIGYMNWVINKRAEFEDESIMAKMATRMIELYPEAILPKPQNKHWGAVGKRAEVHGTVISCRYFDRQDGSGFHITNFVTDDGALLVAFGSFEADAGDKITIKATVKRHDDYKGEAQTIVNRIVQIGPMQDWAIRAGGAIDRSILFVTAPSFKAATKVAYAAGRYSHDVITRAEYDAMKARDPTYQPLEEAA